MLGCLARYLTFLASGPVDRAWRDEQLGWPTPQVLSRNKLLAKRPPCLDTMTGCTDIMEHFCEILPLPVGIVLGPLCFFRDHPLQRLDLEFCHGLFITSFPPFLGSGGI